MKVKLYDNRRINQMRDFDIILTGETKVDTIVTVSAESSEEAMDKVDEMWQRGEIPFDDFTVHEDIDRVDIDVY